VPTPAGAVQSTPQHHIIASGEIPQGVTEKVLKQELLKRYHRDLHPEEDNPAQAEMPA